MTETEFISLLQMNGLRPERRGERWVALCPSHTDKRPSLAVLVQSPRILIKCRSRNCPPKAICKALGITLGDLFTDEPQWGQRYDLSQCRFRLSEEQHDSLSEADGERIHDASEKPEDVRPIWSAMAKTSDPAIRTREGYRYREVLDASGQATNVIREDGTIWPFGGWTGCVGNVASLPRDRPIIFAGDFDSMTKADLGHWLVPLSPEGEPELESGYSLGRLMAAVRPARAKVVEFEFVEWAVRDAAQLGIALEIVSRP